MGVVDVLVFIIKQKKKKRRQSWDPGGTMNIKAFVSVFDMTPAEGRILKIQEEDRCFKAYNFIVPWIFDHFKWSNWGKEKKKNTEKDNFTPPRVTLHIFFAVWNLNLEFRTRETLLNFHKPFPLHLSITLYNRGTPLLVPLLLFLACVSFAVSGWSFPLFVLFDLS